MVRAGHGGDEVLDARVVGEGGAGFGHGGEGGACVGVWHFFLVVGVVCFGLGGALGGGEEVGGGCEVRWDVRDVRWEVMVGGEVRIEGGRGGLE